MSTKPIMITLFHMKNCIHCDDFMPVWKNLCKMQQSNIGFRDYESGQVDSLGSDATINGKPILGFPTIKIAVMNKQYNYGEDRTETAILEFIRNKLKDQVNGVMSETESESEHSLLSGIRRSASTSEVHFGGSNGDAEEHENENNDGSPKSDGSPKDDGSPKSSPKTESDGSPESSPKDSPKVSPKENEVEESDGSPKVSSEVRKSPSIFSPVDKKDTESESAEVKDLDGGFRMSEFDKLLMQEITGLSEIGGF
jgi:hypothetical protein